MAQLGFVFDVFPGLLQPETSPVFFFFPAFLPGGSKSRQSWNGAPRLSLSALTIARIRAGMGTAALGPATPLPF